MKHLFKRFICRIVGCNWVWRWASGGFETLVCTRCGRTDEEEQ